MKISIAALITMSGLLLAGATTTSFETQIAGNVAGILIFWIGGRSLVIQCRKAEKEEGND